MKTLSTLLALALGLVLATTHDPEPGHAAPTTDGALRQLLDGNERFVAGRLAACGKTTPALRQKLAAGQAPLAVVLSCSDSRLPPELVFDGEPGQIFVVRVAGNTVDPVVLGSIEYAAEHLGTPLIVVLGHERCGAITAAVDATGTVEGNIGALVNALSPAVEVARRSGPGAGKAALVEASMIENVKLVARNLTKQSRVLAHLKAEGKIAIVGARYDLDDGKVTLVDGAAGASSN